MNDREALFARFLQIRRSIFKKATEVRIEAEKRLADATASASRPAELPRRTPPPPRR
jgi:hypothetical protein